MKQKSGYFLPLAFVILSACGGKGSGTYEVVEQSSGCMLCDAVRRGSVEEIEFALDLGENPNIVDAKRMSMLMHAAKNGNVAISEMLIQAGANVNATDENGNTALIWAISFGHTEVVKILLACGADPRLRNGQGVDALYWANKRQAAMSPIFQRYFAAVRGGKVFQSCKD